MDQLTIMTASSTGPGITAPTNTFATCAVYKSETNETKEDDTDSQDTQRDSARVSSDPWAFGGYVDADGRKMSVCTKSLLLVVSGLVMVVGAISAGIVADNNSAQANNDAGMSPQLIDDNMSTSILPSQPTLRPTQANAVASAPPTRDSAAVAINRAHVERTARNITAKGFGDVDKLQLSMKQITFGAHTLFGYIGQSLTIPWSKNEKYIVALESSFHDHLPLAHEAARIILINTKDDGYMTEYCDETRGWNLQQGSMLFWNPHSPNSQFFFNDRDPRTNKVFTVLFDVATRTRVREYRFDDMPVANGGVCPEGGFFFALNYARMARLRPVTGYKDLFDWTVNSTRPGDDGIWKVDIASGRKELIISYADIASHFDDKDDFPAGEAELYINHSLCSRGCSKIYFFVRGRYLGKEQAVNQAFVANSDGSLLKRVKYIGGHPEWATEDLIFGKSGRGIVFHNITSDETETALGRFDDPRGDLALSTDSTMFVNGWEEENQLFYHIVRLTDGMQVKSVPLERGPYANGELRIDAAPRWNRKGNKLLIPGWVEGHRQLHVIEVNAVDTDVIA